jgi:hypothetical protein
MNDDDLSPHPFPGGRSLLHRHWVHRRVVEGRRSSQDWISICSTSISVERTSFFATAEVSIVYSSSADDLTEDIIGGTVDIAYDESRRMRDSWADGSPGATRSRGSVRSASKKPPPPAAISPAPFSSLKRARTT